MRIPNADGRLDNMTAEQFMDALGLEVPEGFKVDGASDGAQASEELQKIAATSDIIEQLLGATFLTFQKMGMSLPDMLNAMAAGFGGFLGTVMRAHKDGYPDPMDGKEGIGDKDREEMIEGVCDCAKLNGLASYRTHELRK